MGSNHYLCKSSNGQPQLRTAPRGNQIEIYAVDLLPARTRCIPDAATLPKAAFLQNSARCEIVFHDPSVNRSQTHFTKGDIGHLSDGIRCDTTSGVTSLAQKVPDHCCVIGQIDVSKADQPTGLTVRSNQEEAILPVAGSDCQDRGIPFAIAPLAREPAIDFLLGKPSRHLFKVVRSQFFNRSHYRLPVAGPERREFLPQDRGPLVHIKPELTEEGIHPTFIPPADTSAAGGPPVDLDVKRLAEGHRVKVG